MKVEVLRESIRELQENFSRTPLDYTSEQSLLSTLQSLLREEGKRIIVSASYRGFEDEEYTEYKEGYLERICNGEAIDNVQIAVNFGDGKNDRILDLAVLREDYTEIRLIDGKKYFTPESIEHAVELKFLESENVPPKDPVGTGFEEEFEKLRDLGEPKSRHLVIFSNKNVFQDSEEDEMFTETARGRFQELENRFRKINVIVEECFPGKKIKEEW